MVDEEILEENKLPPWMELDTLYLYKFTSKTSKKEQKKRNKNEGFFGNYRKRNEKFQRERI